MRDRSRIVGMLAALLACMAAWWMILTAQTPTSLADEAILQEARNLGKAFYETPGSSRLAVEQLRKALELNPGSAREHLNYGLALLRAGQREEGMAEVVQAQKIDRTLPHTYFNLGIEYKKSGEVEKAIDQLLQMQRLVPAEAKTQYNLGALYKQIGNTRRAIEKFERTIELDPSLAAPHFQLFGILRRTDPERATAELEIFKALKDATEDDAVGEDVDWSFYSELYDPSLATGVAAPAGPFAFESSAVASLAGEPAGALTWDLDADGTADALFWSDEGAAAVRGRASGGPVRFRVDLAGARHYGAGDFDGDGVADLCRVDGSGAQVLVNPLRAVPFDGVRGVGGLRSVPVRRLRPRQRLRSVLPGARPPPAPQRRGREFRRRHRGVSLRGGPDPGRRHRRALRGQRPRFRRRVRRLGGGPPGPEAGRVRPGGGRRGRRGARRRGAPGRDRCRPRQLPGHCRQHGRRYAAAAQPGGHAFPPDRHLARVEAWADFQLRGRLDPATAEGFLANGGDFDFAGVPGSAEPAPGPAVSGDFNADGRPDLLAAGPGGEIRFAANAADTANRGLVVRLEGVKSPAIGTGARVEVKSGLGYAKRVYAGVPLNFGLGPQESFDTIRVTWANGLIQNEMPEEPAAEIAIREAPRLSGSCPMVFTWNGAEFEYISEVLGVAPLGASLARGVYFPVDHDEYVTIRGSQLRERDGYLDVRVTEELRETAYIDKIRLIAVDHPEHLHIVTNEKAKGPPFPEFRLFGVRDRILPVAARNHRGEDVLGSVTRSDRRYAMFERDYENRAERHSLALEFPGFEAGDATLFLEGWVDWSSASSIVAASQTRDASILPPYLEVRDASGGWTTAVSDLGLPGGTLRTIAIDLGGKFPSAFREVRITTNMCVYWDAAYVALDAGEPETRLTHVAADSAELRFRGFSRNYTAEGRTQPERFDYQQVSATSNWNPTPGLYTRFGDVRRLLAGVDDRYVIFGAGDEIALRFPSAGLPALPAGWRRDYLLLVDGWAKENEANTAFGDSVAPLPFHEMSAYPYGEDERYPRTPEQRADLERLHTRPAMRLLRPLVAQRPPR